MLRFDRINARTSFAIAALLLFSIILFGSTVAYAAVTYPTTTFVTTVGEQSDGLAFDSSGNLYVANRGNDAQGTDGDTVDKVTLAGVVTTFASTGERPWSDAFDSSGNLYVANHTSNTISKITPSGTVTTFASVGSDPSYLIFDSSGNLYEANETSNTISKITPSGTVTTFASVGSDPAGLAFDSSGNLYSANWGANTVSKITPSGTVTTFATVGSEPWALVFDSSGNLYTANYGAGTVSKITPGGIVTTAWATVGSEPYALAFGPDGNLYVANQNTAFVSQITPGGTVTSFAISSSLSYALAFGPDGNLYVAHGDDISKLTLPTRPTATITSSLGATMQVGQSSTIQTSAVAGNDGDAITATEITQSYNAGGQTTDNSSASATTNYTFTPTAAGTYVFYGYAETSAYPSWYHPSGASVVVTVTNSPPTCTVTLTPNPVDAGQSSTLQWTTSNSPNWLLINNVGYISTSTSSGSFSVTPSTTTDYTCSVNNAAGTAPYSSPASLTVYQLPMCRLAVSPSSIIRGGSATLTYFSQNVTSFSITPSIGTVTQNATATASVSPTTSTTYTGSVSGPGGSAQCTVPTGATSTLAVSCTQTTTYSCNGLTTIVQTSTSTSCVVTTNSNYGSCSSPGYCLAGDSYCYYSSPDFTSFGSQSTGNLTLHPSLVHQGKSIKVFWNVLSGSALSCNVSGNNGDYWPGLSSGATGVTSALINQATTYTLSCLNDSGVSTTTETATVNVVPTYQEQ